MVQVWKTMLSAKSYVFIHVLINSYTVKQRKAVETEEFTGNSGAHWGGDRKVLILLSNFAVGNLHVHAERISIQ